MISIRPVHPEEAEELSRIALAAKAYWGYPQRWLELWSPQLTFSPEYFRDHESWAADLDEQVVAFYTLLDQEGKAAVENLWVTPACIGRGVGRALFLHAAGLARQRGYSILCLEADPNAAGFYEKMGMHKIGERHYSLDSTPRVLPVMEMEL